MHRTPSYKHDKCTATDLDLDWELQLADLTLLVAVNIILPTRPPRVD